MSKEHYHPPQRVEGRFYDQREWDSVTCRVCSHRCSIAPGRSGNCGIRTNREGRLYLDTYGRIASAEVLCAEDLPLFHYKPNIDWLRLGSKGCTMRCPFCNTFRFSQTGAVRTVPMTPRQVVEDAMQKDCRGISFGVSEPAPIHEFVFDVFERARQEGLETHVATGGMWSAEALRELVPHLTSVTLGLKGYHEELYRKYLGAEKDTIDENIDLLLTLGVHLEISWLVIPGFTDDPGQASELIQYLNTYGKYLPILLLTYVPDYTWQGNTKESSLDDLGRFHSEFGSYPGATYILHPDSLQLNTRCRDCGRTLIRRGVARSVVTSFPSGRPKDQCPSCGTRVPYVVDQ